MFRENRKEVTPKWRAWARVPGVRAAAAAFGVTPGHLHGVVTGKRTSRGLLARYQVWAAERGLAR